MTLYQPKSTSRAFTLLEVLVVVSIMTVLSSVILAGTQQAKAKANDSARIQGLVQVRTALELYRADHGMYPQTYGAIGQPVVPTYASTIPGLSPTYISSQPHISDDPPSEYVSDGTDYLYYVGNMHSPVNENSVFSYSNTTGTPGTIAAVYSPGAPSKDPVWTACGGDACSSASLMIYEQYSVEGNSIPQYRSESAFSGLSTAPLTLYWNVVPPSACTFVVTGNDWQSNNKLTSILSPYSGTQLSSIDPASGPTVSGFRWAVLGDTTTVTMDCSSGETSSVTFSFPNGQHTP